MPFNAGALIIGVKGTVVAVDRSTGETLWSTKLKGGQFVTVAVEDGAIFAGNQRPPLSARPDDRRRAVVK